jgi:hypothetical protein
VGRSPAGETLLHIDMQPEIKYIELKSGFSNDGPAWIGLVSYSKSGRTLYFNGRAFQRIGSDRMRGNFYDIESGEEYWFSGVKKNQQDRHWAGNGKVFIENRIAEDYKNLIGINNLDSKQFELVTLIEEPPIARIKDLENESYVKEVSPHDLSFKEPNELTIDQLNSVIDYLSNQESEMKFNKARRSYKNKRKQLEEEIEKRNVL